ncbi:hypothetical protein BLOT_016257 [Blomia tropicalis]|nr:hypothetical protein BLOT_016257 [Blomia tropicalis]
MSLITLPDVCLLRIISWLSPQELWQLDEIHERFVELRLYACHQVKRVIATTSELLSTLDENQKLIKNHENNLESIVNNKKQMCLRFSNIAIEIYRLQAYLFTNVTSIHLVVMQDQLERYQNVICDLLHDYKMKLEELKLTILDEEPRIDQWVENKRINHTFEYWTDDDPNTLNQKLLEEVLLFNLQLFAQYNAKKYGFIEKIIFRRKLSYPLFSVEELDKSIRKRFLTLNLYQSEVLLGLKDFHSLIELRIEIFQNQYHSYLRMFQQQLPTLLYLQIWFVGIITDIVFNNGDDMERPCLPTILELELNLRISSHSVIESLRLLETFPNLKKITVILRGSSCSTCGFSKRLFNSPDCSNFSSETTIQEKVFGCLRQTLKRSLGTSEKLQNCSFQFYFNENKYELNLKSTEL